jgi:hypothetical protein
MSTLNAPMNNLNALIAAGVIPKNHTLSAADIDTINDLSTEEVDTIIALKTRLGADFIKRNAVDAANIML